MQQIRVAKEKNSLLSYATYKKGVIYHMLVLMTRCLGTLHGYTGNFPAFIYT